MLQTNGLSKPLLINLYPQVLKEGLNIDCDLETTYSIYGGLTPTQQLMHSTYNTYSNSLELEGV
jgi:hypothetical protein